MIGIAASLMLKANGQITGVSGIMKGASRIFRVFAPHVGNSAPWRCAFIGGLSTGSVMVSKAWLGPQMISAVGMSPAAMIVSGALVGLGTSVSYW